ncbi:MAG: maleylpyruvate isomerase family mycothiol-dependent enzyme [Actinomycetota bacterium]|nr:maleylpyruvate isomerase family mycothiol-dependent enzyme [Actinomycetota bacterium]
MDAAGHIAACRAEGDLLADLAAPGFGAPVLGVAVPTCPEWDLAALVAHTGGVHRRVTQSLRTNAAPVGKRPEPPEGGDLLAWYRQGLDDLVDEMERDDDPGTPAWTWAGTRSRGWWYRRMAAETAVHRVDGQIARRDLDGTAVTPIATDLALDAIDEHLTEFLPGLIGRAGGNRLSGSLHIHATDGDGEWWLDLDSVETGTRREHAKADTAIRGTASDLLLWLWGRIPASSDQLQVFGATSTLDELAQLNI